MRCGESFGDRIVTDPIEHLVFTTNSMGKEGGLWSKNERPEAYLPSLIINKIIALDFI